MSTRQLVNQVAEQASLKYGIELHAFTGSERIIMRRRRPTGRTRNPSQSQHTVAYSTQIPSFATHTLYLLDDAHSSENYVSKFWSLQIERAESEREGASRRY